MNEFRRSLRNNAETSGIRHGRVFRPIILILVLAAVCWGFWTNSQKRIDELTMRALFSDETGSVESAQREEILTLLKNFKKNFGMPLEVHIREHPPALEAQDASRMYIDIVPSRGRAYIFLPPLVRHAVGPDFIRDVELSFAQDFAAGDWRISIVPAILVLRNKLEEVTR